MTSRVGFEWCWAKGYYGIESTILLRFIEDYYLLLIIRTMKVLAPKTEIWGRTKTVKCIVKRDVIGKFNHETILGLIRAMAYNHTLRHRHRYT